MASCQIRCSSSNSKPQVFCEIRVWSFISVSRLGIYVEGPFRKRMQPETEIVLKFRNREQVEHIGDFDRLNQVVVKPDILGAFFILRLCVTCHRNKR